MKRAVAAVYDVGLKEYVFSALSKILILWLSWTIHLLFCFLDND